MEPNVDPPVLRCPKVKPFPLGRGLNTSAWRSTPAIPLSPSSGKQEPHLPASFRVCWTDTHLLAAFRCTEENLRCTHTRRDDPLYDEDVVELFLAPDPSDPCRYFELEFSPRAVIFDATVVNPTADGSGRPQVDKTWNCPGLDVKARIGKKFWEVEVAVPFAGLGVPIPKPGDTWRVNAYRIDYGPPDFYLAWSPTRTPRPNYHVPNRFGTLVFADHKG